MAVGSLYIRDNFNHESKVRHFELSDIIFGHYVIYISSKKISESSNLLEQIRCLFNSPPSSDLLIAIPSSAQSAHVSILASAKAKSTPESV